MLMFKLTAEGREYLENGLPEKNLVTVLQKGQLRFDAAKKAVDNFPIAFQWAKKKEWVEVKDGLLRLVKEPESFPEQVALQRIDKGEAVEEELLNVLIQRKLVEKVTEEMEEVRKLAGKEVVSLTQEMIKTGLWKDVKFRPYNVQFAGKKIFAGKRQPYNQFLMDVREKLVQLGFKEMAGPTIETEFWNFDALYQPQNHPARDWTQTYSLKKPKHGDLPWIANKVKDAHEKGVAGGTGWRYKWNPKIAMQLMPRAHGTALSARTMADKPEIPGKYFAIARCYRPDVIDVTHGVEFNQCEGIVLGESLTFKNLLGILKMFAIEVAGAKQVKFIPDYYPFTEPSVQLSAKHPQLGWIEFGGSGIFREELTKPLGINVPVIAWGLGIDRLAMFKLKLNDIRNLFTRDLEWLRNQPVV